MTDTIWIHHPQTDGKAEVPRDTLPVYRQSGWEPLEGDDLDTHLTTLADEVTTAEQRLVELGKEGLRNAGMVPEERPEYGGAVAGHGPDLPVPRETLPAKNAPKAEWERVARDRKIPEDEIQGSTKDQLVARLNKE